MKYRVYTQTEKSTARNHVVNEDRYLFTEYIFNEDKPIHLLIVADGMGGLEDGEQASMNAVRGFSKAFYEKVVDVYMCGHMESFSLSYFADKVEWAVREAMHSANAEVLKNSDVLKPSGATISVVCIIDRCAVCANIGDSPIYFYRSKKRKLKLVSKLQTQAELDVEAGVYERYSSSYYAKDNILYHSLGQYSKMDEEDIYTYQIGGLQKGDIFLVGSDGAFGRIQEYELLELLEDCSEDDEEFILEELFDMARMDKNDDQTAIFYVVGD